MARLSLALAHRDGTARALGCVPCGMLGTCGGLHISAPVWSCDSYCRCADPAACQRVCPRKTDEYARREREVGGFDLGTVTHAPPTAVPDLPAFVPLVYGNTGLTRPVPAAAVAVPLERLFRRKDGRPRLADGDAVRARYGIGPDARLVVSGVGRDAPIERYWDTARSAGFVDWLVRVRPDLVTVPNFSLFNEVPREDNLHAMKRIAICWSELAGRGVPTALHLNARTERDWERWAEFLASYPEVAAVAFEFATGAAVRERGWWHTARLCEVARVVGRPLTLVARGGHVHLPRLAGAFSRVVFLSPTPYLRTMKRKQLYRPGGRGAVRWADHPTGRGRPLDGLFEANLAAFAAVVTGLRPRG